MSPAEKDFFAIQFGSSILVFYEDHFEEQMQNCDEASGKVLKKKKLKRNIKIFFAAPLIFALTNLEKLDFSGWQKKFCHIIFATKPKNFYFVFFAFLSYRRKVFYLGLEMGGSSCFCSPSFCSFYEQFCPVTIYFLAWHFM